MFVNGCDLPTCPQNHKHRYQYFLMFSFVEFCNTRTLPSQSIVIVVIDTEAVSSELRRASAPSSDYSPLDCSLLGGEVYCSPLPTVIVHLFFTRNVDSFMNIVGWANNSPTNPLSQELIPLSPSLVAKGLPRWFIFWDVLFLHHVLLWELTYCRIRSVYRKVLVAEVEKIIDGNKQVPQSKLAQV